jgi:hypothetical protein
VQWAGFDMLTSRILPRPRMSESRAEGCAAGETGPLAHRFYSVPFHSGDLLIRCGREPSAQPTFAQRAFSERGSQAIHTKPYSFRSIFRRASLKASRTCFDRLHHHIVLAGCEHFGSSQYWIDCLASVSKMISVSSAKPYSPNAF